MPELADHHADDLAGFGSGGGGDPGGAKLGDLPACQVGEPSEQGPSRGVGVKYRAGGLRSATVQFLMAAS